MTFNSRAPRTSSFNKSKSPIVEQNYKARANKVSDLEKAPEVSKTKSNDTKLTKATGLGRRRSMQSAYFESRDEALPVIKENENEGLRFPFDCSGTLSACSASLSACGASLSARGFK